MENISIFWIVVVLLTIAGASKGIMDNIARGIWKGWWNKQDSWQYKYNMHVPKVLIPFFWKVMFNTYKFHPPFWISWIVSVGGLTLFFLEETSGHPLAAIIALWLVCISIPIIWIGDTYSFPVVRTFKGPKIPNWLSSTLLVPLSDGWHFFQLLTNSCWQIAFAISLIGDFSINMWLMFLGIKLIFNGAFFISYRIQWRS